MKLLIATKNPGKAREMSDIMGESFEIVTLRDFPDAPDVNETGETFEENAILKAKTFFEWSGIPAIAGDGGLEIDALDGEPGVFSRRWPFGDEEPGKPGREKTDQEAIDIAIDKLKGVSRDKRTARLRDVEAFYDGTHTFTESGAIEGRIVEERSTEYEPGYPFRAIFEVLEYDKLFRDLSEEEHDAINHRRKALRKLRERILKEASS